METALTARREYGAGEPYIARIDATRSRRGLYRELIKARRYSSPAHKSGFALATITEPGLYEVCDTHARGQESAYYYICEAQGKIQHVPIAEATLYAIIEGVLQGRKLEELRIRVDASEKPARCTRSNGSPDWLSPTRSKARLDAIKQIRTLMSKHRLTIEDFAAESDKTRDRRTAKGTRRRRL